MAEGGEVGFCKADRAHNPDCEYFAEGGLVPVPENDLPAMPGAAGPDTSTAGLTPVPESDLPQETVDEEKYGGIGQQALAGVEGLAQGVAGPLATLAETKILGVKPEDIAGRQRANPYTHGIAETAGFAGSMLTGVGEAGLIAKGAEAAAHAAELGKMGSAILKGAINSGLFQAGDEVSKAILGQGDPNDGVGAAIAHTGAAALMGGLFGGGGSLASSAAKKGLEKVAESKFGEKASYLLHGLAKGVEADTPEALEKIMADTGKIPDGMKSAYKQGVKLTRVLTGHAGGPLMAGMAEGIAGAKEDGMEGAVKGFGQGVVHGVLFDLARKPLRGVAQKYAAPMLMKVLSSGDLNGAFEAFDHAANIAKGYKAINDGIESLFTVAGIGSQKALDGFYSDSGQDRVDKFIRDGGNPQEIQQALYENAGPSGYAEGGQAGMPMVEPNGMEIHYPEQNMAMSAAKARVSNYLSSLRPQPGQPKLAFDDEPDLRGADKSYKRALDIAVKPLGVLEEIKHGTLEPQDVKHLSSMYPELHNLIQKQMTERITKAQLAGDKPTYKVRQGMSLLMGTALSSELQPQNIMGAQAAFAPAGAPQQPQQAPQKKSGGGSKSALSKSSQAYLTGNQALARRGQRTS